jgi:predicted transcriptional regulator
VTCLFDGREFKSLRRHLENEHAMSPQEYREFWGLPKDSPMVAPNYAAARSALALAAGLGQKGRNSGRDAAPPAANDTPPVAAPKRRGRPPKAG